MIKGTFDELAEIATKNYDQKARQELEKQLNFFVRQSSKEVVIELGLPQVFMFLSSTVSKSNNNKIIQTTDVKIAFSVLRYLLSRNFIENILDGNFLNIGIPLHPQLNGRLNNLLKIKGDMKTKSNLDGKVTRMIDFLSEQKLQSKHVSRIEIEMRAVIMLLSRLLADSKRKEMKVYIEDIDNSYDFVRYLIFKLDPTPLIIINQMYEIDDEKIWRKIPKLNIDQSTHDHLSNTAYAQWENNIPTTFESMKKLLNCSPRPFIAAIYGFSEIYCAKKNITRITSHEMLYILEEFEKTIFGNLNPIVLENAVSDITFTKEGLSLLAKISKWIPTIIINRFGKDEYVFNFSSTVSRHMSLLLFIALVEKVRNKDDKIDIKHVAFATSKWVEQLKILSNINSNI